jgi:NTP pyrophosphatase (non-canonical NTP hydrolase)
MERDEMLEILEEEVRVEPGDESGTWGVESRVDRFALELAAEGTSGYQDAAASVMSSTRADDVRDELADVLIYLARLADVLEVDLVEVARDKVERNDRRFPRDEVRGRADHRPSAEEGDRRPRG